ncbi:hypothetical protein BA6E_101180 [Bacteroidales bacterium 6E]|nr:hypothetical protein BA6E_101180 [Bacteroidales bacterium 6E]
MKNNTALVVLSCDNYSDLWPLFISQFEKEWPNCQYDKFITSNFLDVQSSTFKCLKVGKDNSWSDGVIKALNILKNNYEYALVTLEDLILTEKVNNDLFQSMVSEFIKLNGNYLKFIRKPRPTNYFNEYFGEIQPGSLYRPTCVYALWKIDTLLMIIREEENAWEFERFGSIRSDKYPNFFVVYQDFFKVSNTVVKGSWVPKEKRKFEKLNYTISPDRKTLSYNESVRLKLSTFVFNLFTSICPWKFRRTIVFKLKGYAS